MRSSRRRISRIRFLQGVCEINFNRVNNRLLGDVEGEDHIFFGNDEVDGITPDGLFPIDDE